MPCVLGRMPQLRAVQRACFQDLPRRVYAARMQRQRSGRVRARAAGEQCCGAVLCGWCAQRLAGALTLNPTCTRQQVRTLVAVARHLGATQADIDGWMLRSYKALNRAVYTRAAPLVEALLSHMQHFAPVQRLCFSRATGMCAHACMRCVCVRCAVHTNNARHSEHSQPLYEATGVCCTKRASR